MHLLQSIAVPAARRLRVHCVTVPRALTHPPFPVGLVVLMFASCKDNDRNRIRDPSTSQGNE
ncbi:hypothetical protein K466DRAFT_590536 [Polyporus arcularius HHB13444]|uniref:Uncharacterized protein n=1 Tax=Polyporus arcularius HHB13444 TaxID=1314778 RepID=A0A5C3NYB5_9APHY|nr:hypothetical protein K466DRAFT_590536 [Polyporus arcularius HHB13444]